MWILAAVAVAWVATLAVAWSAVRCGHLEDEQRARLLREMGRER
jgi:hypothetical protein